MQGKWFGGVGGVGGLSWEMKARKKERSFLAIDLFAATFYSAVREELLLSAL